MSILASELERRAKAAVDLMEKSAKNVEIFSQKKDELKSLMKDIYEKGSKAGEIRATVESNYLVFDVRESEIVKGSERVLAVGGGIRATIGKTKEGKTVITKYMFDRDRFEESAAQKWLEKNSRTIDKSVAMVQENAPSGSFMDITLRVQNELNGSDLFPRDEYGMSLAYLCYVFPGYVVVDYGGQYYRVDYSEESGPMTLGDPVAVDMQFVAKESGAQMDRFKKSLKPNMSFSPEAAGIKEATFNDEKREAVLVLIEAGKNFTKRRYYPKETLKEAAPMFAGLKMYLDHATAAEEREKPERSLGDWVSTIVESWYDDGKIMGRVKVHNEDFWKKLKEDQVFRDNVAVSINASGKRYLREIDGVEMEVIEKIVNPKSVDWVTEPGARGRVEYILESKRKEREEDENMLKTVTLEEVKKERPDLIEAARAEGKAEGLKESEGVKEAAVKAERDRVAAEKLKEARASKIRELLGASKLPKRGIEKLVDALMKESFASDEELEKKVKEAIAGEFAYISEVSGRKIGVDPQTDKGSDAVSKIQENLEQRVGVGEEKKEEKK